jgi:uncharacterized alkaline shock family protein YloU
MNIFNRIVMSLLSFMIFAFGTVVFLLLTGIVAPRNVYLRAILALYNGWRALMALRGDTTNIALLVALALMLVGLVVLVLELLPLGRLRSGGKEAKQYIVRQDSLGQVTLARSMAQNYVRHVAESVPGVTHAEAEVKDAADGLHLTVHSALAWDAVTPSVGQQLQEQVKESVQTQLGLPVAEVRVIAEAAPIAKERSRSTPRVA